MTLKVTFLTGEMEIFKNISAERIARNFEVFEANPIPTDLKIPFLLTTKSTVVRQLLEDRIAINTINEMLDTLTISRHWRRGLLN
jgi:hypothetical protein